MDELKARIQLNTILDIGPVRANRFLVYFGSIVKLFAGNQDEIIQAGNVSKQTAQKILSVKNTFDVEKEIETAKSLGIDILTSDNPAYPEQLKTIADPPLVLYARGKFKNEDIYSIAIVGTRKPTEYGKIVTSRLTKELAEMGLTIVSGLARGVDTIAHWSTLKANKRTAAVLGNGLGIHYPAENRELENKISKSGVLVSEFHITCMPDKTSFPRRNRVISGLSLGTVVIEGDEKSGALITARHAADQGRDIFAVPGSVMSKYSHGPHILIKNGAKLVENATDIVEDIAFIGNWLKNRPKPEQENIKNSELPLLNSFEEKILRQLESYPDGINIDNLIESVNCPFGKLSESLLSLEIKGIAKALPGKVYIKIS